jgi:hypothetical protein
MSRRRTILQAVGLGTAIEQALDTALAQHEIPGAPPKLAELARIEQQRDASGMFPLMLSESGALLTPAAASGARMPSCASGGGRPLSASRIPRTLSHTSPSAPPLGADVLTVTLLLV